jgi:hypothetical protein
MGTEEQTGGNKPKQTNQPGQGKPNPQQEQRKDRENQPGGHDKGTGQQGGGSGGMRNDR